MERFVHRITVAPSDIDMFGHANNVEYVRWVIDVAVAHSNAVGLTWADYERLGGAFIVRRHAVEYMRGAREGEALDVATWLESATRITAERSTEITNAAGEVVARAQTTWVFVALATLRPARIPPEVRTKFGEPPPPAGK